jgi:hypothetical protein
MFKVPTKADAGKPILIWTQWTWKPSPKSIGYDGDENGRRRPVYTYNMQTRIIRQWQCALALL